MTDRIPVIMVVIGTRPEAIKLAPVIQELRLRPVRTVVVLSGQHAHLVPPVLDFFKIRPDDDLRTMRTDHDLTDSLASIITGLGRTLKALRPDWLIAQGDTTTCLAAALASAQTRTRFAHVEAGLRSGDSKNPWPEEFNRRVADTLADLLFAPTEGNAANLRASGLDPAAIAVTGNPGVDALFYAMARPPDLPGPLADLDGRTIALISVHRRENHGGPLTAICTAIEDLANRHQDMLFLWPLHPNPSVGRAVRDQLKFHPPNVRLLDPLNYPTAAHVLAIAQIVLTDSGGIQEEAATLGIPAVVLRDNTERPESVADDLAYLAGSDPRRIAEGFAHRGRRPRSTLYGDGRAAPRIVDRLLQEVTP